MKERIWEDKDGNYLKIRPRANGKAVRIEANVFDAADLRTLDEVITHLQWMRGVFAAPEPPAVPKNLVTIKEDLRFELADGKPRSTVKIVSLYVEDEHENVKAAILYLGDSRRGEAAELILARDDRTEAMMGEEEKALMPSEVQDGKRVYYCTVQRRAK